MPTDGPVFPQGDRHWALRVGKTLPFSRVDSPGATPFVDADLGMASPQIRGRFVVEGNAASGVRGVDGYAEAFEQPPILALTFAESFFQKFPKVDFAKLGS